MSVNVGQRNVPNTPANTQLEALQKLKKFRHHTILITKNKKYFLKEYDDLITNPMVALVVQIVGDCDVANKIYVSSYDDFVRRYKLQKRAIENMSRVMSYMEAIQDAVHLRLHRYLYWLQLYEESYEKLKSWHKSDIKRYSQKFKR